jgi:predicted nucleotidyltransferase
VTERLKELVLRRHGDRVRRIILFGSRARGDARPDSDYDLLVVLRDLDPSRRQAMLVGLYEAFCGVGVTVEPHIMGDEEFEETRDVIGGLAYPAAKEGVVLYESA